MAPKRIVRKSRMDLLLENMEAAEKNVMTASDFLAQDDGSSSTLHRGEDDEDDSSSDDDYLSLAQVTSPNTQSVPQRSAMQTVPRQQPTSATLFGAHSAMRSPNGQTIAKNNPSKDQNRSAPFSPLSPTTKSSSDRDFGCVASPLFLSELALRQRKKDMTVERLLLEAEAAGASSHGQPLCALVNALCGTPNDCSYGKSKAKGHAEIGDVADQDLFELDAFIGSGANVDSNKKPDSQEEKKFDDCGKGNIGRYADEATKSLSMLRTMGTSMPSFIASLTQTPLYRRDDDNSHHTQKEKRPLSPSRLVAKAYLAFLRFVFLQCATETIVKPDMFKFLIDILKHHFCFGNNGLGMGGGGHNNDTADTTDEEETICCFTSPKCSASSAMCGLSKQEKPPARGTGSHWAVLLASAASPTTATADEASEPLIIGESLSTQEEEENAIAEDDARRVRMAMSRILTPAELEKVMHDDVSVTELVCDLLAYLLVSSNRQSLFSGGLIAGGGVGGPSGALESQHSDLSDLFMTSSQTGSSQFELEALDAEDGLHFGSDQNPSKITKGVKRQRSSPTFTETDGTEEPLARKRTSPRLENCSASIVFHYLGGFAACLSAVASFVERLKRTDEGANNHNAKNVKAILALEGEENSSTTKIVSMREINKVLSLVEVATCTDALKNRAAGEQVKDVLNRILVMLFELWETIGEGATTVNSSNKNNSSTEKNSLTPAQQKDGLGDASQRVVLRNTLLRVVTNITGVCHDAIPADHEGSRHCAERIALSLTHYSAPVDSDHTTTTGVKSSWADFSYETIRPHVDEVCELICLAINFCRRGANNEFRWALLKAEGIRQTERYIENSTVPPGNFAEWCVGWLRTLYHVEDSSANILAGYLALLLAMLSLGDEEARICVVTALSTNAKEDIRTVASKPLTWVVAVLQEFVLFQSTAQILTKDMVVAMHSVIDRVISENGISISIA